jgi:hypothetical protein
MHSQFKDMGTIKSAGEFHITDRGTVVITGGSQSLHLEPDWDHDSILIQMMLRKERALFEESR